LLFLKPIVEITIQHTLHQPHLTANASALQFYDVGPKPIAIRAQFFVFSNPYQPSALNIAKAWFSSAF
jgi:hypothetical protein